MVCKRIGPWTAAFVALSALGASRTSQATSPAITFQNITAGKIYSTNPSPAWKVTGTAPLSSTGSLFESITNTTTSVTSGETVPNDGSYTLTVYATDGNDNPAQNQISFIVNASLPGIMITGVTNGEVTNQPVTPVVTVTSQIPSFLVSTVTTLNGVTMTTPVTAPGTYTLKVVATDYAGKQATATRVFTIYTMLPKITISGVGQGAYVHTDVTLSTTVTDPYLIDSSVVETLTYYGTAISYSSPTTLSLNGPYVMTVSASDSAGNSNSVTWPFFIDTVAPNVTFSGFMNGELTNQEVTPVVTVTDLYPGSTSITYESATTTYTGDVNATLATTTADGKYTVKVVSTDLANNTANTTESFTVSTALPTFTITGVANGADKQAPNGLAITITEHDTYPGTMQAVLWMTGGPTTTFPATGVKTINIPASYTTTQGAYTLAVTATDAAGNVAVPVSYQFIIDRTAPVVTVSGLGTNACSAGPDTITFSVTDALSPVASVVAKVDGTVITSGFVESAQGAHTLTIVAVDGAGNSTGTQRYPFVISDSIPVVKITTPKSGKTYTAAITPAATETGNGTLVVSASVDMMPFTLGNEYGLNGMHELSVIATDCLGNQGKQTATFTMALPTPVIEVTGVTNDEQTNGQSITPVISIVPSGTTSAKLNGLVYSGGAITAEGQYTLIVNGTDQFGNPAAPVTINFTIDRTSPILIVTGITNNEVSYTPIIPQWSATDPGGVTAYATLSTNGGIPQPFTLGSQIAGFGTDVLVVTASDPAGNTAQQTFSVRVNTTQPYITIVSPTSNASQSPVDVQIQFGDGSQGPGLNPSRTSISMDGSIITNSLNSSVSGELTGTISLGQAQHNLFASVTDNNGALATAQVTFTIGPPVQANVVATQQLSGFFVCSLSAEGNGASTECEIPADGNYQVVVNSRQSSPGENIVEFDGIQLIDSANLQPPAVFATAFTQLTAGQHELSVVQANTGVEWDVFVLNPANACWLMNPVAVTAATPLSPTPFADARYPGGMPVVMVINGDPSGVAASAGSAVFNGTDLLADGTFGSNVSLVLGESGFASSNTISASVPASDPGSFTVEAVDVDFTPPNLTLNPIGDGSGTTSQASVVVSGTIDDPTDAILVNMVPVTSSNGTWTTSVSLTAGANTIAITATDLCGNSSSLTTTEFYLPSPQQPGQPTQMQGNETVVCVAVTQEGDAAIDCVASVAGTYTLLAAQQKDTAVAPVTATVTVNGNTIIGPPDFDPPAKAAAASVQLVVGDNWITVEGEDVGAYVNWTVLNLPHACFLDPSQPFLQVEASDSSATQASFNDNNPETRPHLVVLNGMPTGTFATSGSFNLNGTDVLAGQLGSTVTAFTTTNDFGTMNQITASVMAPTNPVGSFTAIAIDEDDTPPSLTITPYGSGWTAESALTLAGTIDDLSAEITVSVLADGAVNLFPGTKQGSTWSAAITLGGGLNQITVTATDPCNNTSTAGFSIEETTIAPLVTINLPTGVELPAGATNLQVTIEDYVSGLANGTFSAQLLVPDGSTEDVSALFQPVGQPTGSEVVEALTKDLAAGQYVLTATATNNAGVSGSDSRYFTLTPVSAPPQINIVSPSTSPFQAPLYVDVTYQDPGVGIDLSTLHIFVDTTEITVLMLSITETEAQGTLTLADAPLGPHTLSVSINSAAEIPTSASFMFNLVDLTEPTISVVPITPTIPSTSPVVYTTNQTTLSVTVTAFESPLVSGLDGIPSLDLMSPASTMAENLTSSGSNTWNSTFNVNAGTQSLIASVTTNGGVSAMSTAQLLVDVTAPTIGFVPSGSTYFMNNSYYTNTGNSVQIAVSYSDPDSGVVNPGSAEITGPDGPCAVMASGAGATCSFDASQLAESIYPLSASVEDYATNEGMASGALYVDRTWPIEVGAMQVTPPALSNAGTQYISAATATFTVTLSDSLSGVNPSTVQFSFDDGGTWQAAAPGSGGEFSIVASVPVGAFTVSVLASDYAGNSVPTDPTQSGSISQAFFGDGLPPVVAVSLATTAPCALADGTIYCGSGTITVTATVSDPTPVTVTFPVSSVPQSYNNVNASAEGGAVLTAQVTLTQPDGPTSMTVTAVNAAGVSGSGYADFTLATTRPEISFVSPAVGTAITSASMPVTIEITDYAPIASADVNGAPASPNGNPTEYTAVNVFMLSNGSGTVSLTAEAVDIVGNSATVANGHSVAEHLPIAPPSVSPVCLANVPSSLF